MKVVFGLMLLLAATSPRAVATTPGEVDVGRMLRDAPMQGLSGPSRLLSDLRGKPLIVNLWASWCGPCYEEMSSLERLSKRHEGIRFTVIGISTDDYPDAARVFLQKPGTTFQYFIDTRLLLENMLGANRIPLTVLIDAKGRVVGTYYGAKEWDTPEALAVIGKAFGTRID